VQVKEKGKVSERKKGLKGRALIEELGIEASAGQPRPTITHHYPSFTVTLYPFICKIISG